MRFCRCLSVCGGSCPRPFCPVSRLFHCQKSFGFRDFPTKQPVHSLKKADLFEKRLVWHVFQKQKPAEIAGF
jgi:hypothetical protein